MRVLESLRNLARALCREIPFAFTAAFALASCSLSRVTDGPVMQVRLEVPGVRSELQPRRSEIDRHGVRHSTSAAAETQTAVPGYPQSLDEFSCLLVRVAGDGISPTAAVPAGPAACTPGAPPARITGLASASTIGIISDPVPISGGSVALDVPIGSARTFQLLGVVTSSGSCPATYDELEEAMDPGLLTRILDGVLGADTLLAEPPIVLASTRADIAGETTVRLTPGYTPESARPVFCDSAEAPLVSWGEVASVQTDASLDTFTVTARLHFNRVVTGFALNDLVLNTAGVEVLSVTPSSLRGYEVVFQLRVDEIPQAAILAETFLDGVLAAGAVSDLYGRLNASQEGTLTDSFLAVAAQDWADATASVVNPSPSPSPSPSSSSGTPPAAPSGLALLSPVQSPGSDADPTLLVSGVTPGDTITLHLVASCGDSPLATEVAYGSSVELTTATLGSSGSYQFYAKATNAAGSACSSGSLAYVYDPTGPDPVMITTPASTPHSTSSSVIAVSGTCLGSSSEVRLVVGGAVHGTTTCASGAFSFPYVSFAAEGTYELSISQSRWGISSEVTKFVVQYDIPPTITLLSFTDFVTGAAVGDYYTQTLWDKVNVSVTHTGGVNQMAILSGEGVDCFDSPAAADWITATSAVQTVSLPASFSPAYSASVATPVAVFIRDSTGVEDCSTTSVWRRSLTVQSHFPGYPYFTSHVAASALANPLSAAACDPSGPDSGCLHAGAYRAVELTGVPSCDGLAAVDALGAFDWTCSVPSTNAVLRGVLKDEKSLSDLVDFADNGWAENTVTLTRTVDGVSAQAASYSGASWWSDSFSTATPTSGETTTLATPGTILLVRESASSSGIILDGDHLAVVIKPGVSLSVSGSGAAVGALCSSADPCDYLWIEGPGTDDASGSTPVNHLNLTSTATGVGLQSVRFAKVRGLRSESGLNGFKFGGGNALELSDLASSTAAQYGFYFTGSSQAYVSGHNLSAVTATLGGFKIYSDLSHFEFDGLQVASNGFGVHVGNAASLTHPGSGIFRNVVAANNTGTGITVATNAPSTPTRWVNVRSYNNGSHGIHLSASTASDGAHGARVVGAYAAFNGGHGVSVQGAGSGVRVNQPYLVGITGVHNTQSGIYLSETQAPVVHNALLLGNRSSGIRADMSDDGVYSQLAAMSNSLADYQSTSSTNGQAVGTIVYSGSNGSHACSSATGVGIFLSASTCRRSSDSTALAALSGSPSVTFVLPTTISESANDSVVSGGGGTLFLDHTAGAGQDWFQFDTPSRLFGRQGITLGATSTFTSLRCVSDTANSCRLYDLALDDDATAFINAAYSGATNGSQSCNGPSGSASNILTASNLGSSTPWHANALEVMGDHSSGGTLVGDDDGLCESGEACLYTPNLGAYQGHGDSVDCLIGSGTLTGVQMIRYDQNGY